MGNPNNNTSNQSKEVSSSAIISKYVTTNEENQVGPTHEFDEARYEIW